MHSGVVRVVLGFTARASRARVAATEEHRRVAGRDQTITGVMLVGLLMAAIWTEWTGHAQAVVAGMALLVVLALLPRARRVHGVFLALSVLLIGLCLWRGESAVVQRAFFAAGSIAAFFAALFALRHAAMNSPAIDKAGRFLAAQPPGRRYAALTLGAHLFGLLIGGGAIALLGALAQGEARREADPVIRNHRIRRMMLAIQRGFLSTLPWSPLSFCLAISLPLVPGASWGAALLPCLGVSALLAGIGWLMDTMFKPAVRPTSRPTPPPGGWHSLSPLFWLLILLTISILGLHLGFGVRVSGVVMLVVPLIAIGWTVLARRSLWAAARDYVEHDLPSFGPELVLVMTATLIGVLTAHLLGGGQSLDLPVPGLVLVVAVIWLIPLAGLLGANPILAALLIVPFVPNPASMGISPAVVVCAVTGGWSLSGAISPFTATNMQVAQFAGVSPITVGLRWNRGYALVTAIAISLWVMLLAVLLPPP